MAKTPASESGKMRKFLIFTPGFDENIGGIVCLHKLCDALNQLGATSALTPYFPTFDISHRDFVKPLGRAIKSKLKVRQPYRTNPGFDTPVVASPGYGADLDDFVVVYSEIVNGNPLGARNVVRWILYAPGGHTGKIHYGVGELIVRFNSGISHFDLPGSTTVADELKVVHYPLELYRPPPKSTQRSGAAYLVRKGSKKSLNQHPNDAIQIDGRTHREIAKILQQVQTFVSYDTYTTYSLFAALTGCDSVVIPDEGVSEEGWYPDPADRYGISYGWNQLDHARSTRHLVRQRMMEEEAKNLENVRNFLAHVDRFFGSSE